MLDVCRLVLPTRLMLGKGYKRGNHEKRGKLTDCLSMRPTPGRSGIGDFEGDTEIGKHLTGVMLSLIDRRSRLLFASKLQNKDLENLAEPIVGLLKDKFYRAIMVDNGKEFAQHKYISDELGAPVYFFHPHSPWERGPNEITN